ncbi:MATE family efflux transporter [Prosthecomicrobium pneumaticum]|uniref:Multidrug-efflux transporter n=1 Tax=Prosthecomicrobium pneumaticum TaxID=81895 RepID=A0A7W9CTF4_9HYPH|nr:MATE family efflux transporter [Prosthecomicrobium pneumaticum]MBB5751082.1 MATE family multidrug resistance protein [Prosthecomicrobium pneumaticum]
MTTAVHTAGREDASLRPWAAEARATLALSWPMILTNLAQTALNATDVILVGWMGGHALAAAALGTNLYFALLIFGIGLTGATAPMIARERGRNRHAVREVRRTVRQGLWASVALAVPFWLVLWHTEAILLAFRQEPRLAADAGIYMRGLQWALLPFLFYLVLRSFVAALERPMWSVAVGLMGVAVNAVAVWALVFGHFGLPRMGLLGAGIGSTLAATMMALGMALVVSVDRRFRRYRLFGRFWRADWGRFRELWRLGLPMAFAICFEVTVFNAAVFLMGLIGADSVAAHAIAIQIASLTFMVPLGFSQAVTVRVGRAYGAGDREAIRRAGWVAFAMTIAFMSVTCAVMILAPGVLIGAFIDRADPANAEVFALAVVFLGVAGIFQIFDGAQAVVAGMLRGLHDTRVPMIYAGLGFWGVGLSSSVAFGFGLGLEGLGIWIGLACGLGVVAALLIARWLRRDRLGLERGGHRAVAPAH